MGIVVAILVLSFLIFFHELGHFSAARFFGVTVEVFSIGFGRKMTSWRRGSTEYRIAMIPLGGYVKMKGQDDSDPTLVNTDNDSYTALHPFKRLVILAAGPLANLTLAFLLYSGAVSAGMTILTPTVGKIAQDSPAALVLHSQDRILAIDSHPIQSWDDIGAYIRESNGSLTFRIQRVQQILEVSITPKIAPVKTIFGETVFHRVIGIMPSGETTVIYPSWEEIPLIAIQKTYNASLLILQSLEKLISGVVSVDNVGGVISIVDVTAKVSATGWQALALLTALISVNLGILNLLPIPALDGGHMMFTLYEMVTGHPPSQEILYRLTLVGWGLLGSLMILGFYNDIMRLTHG